MPHPQPLPGSFTPRTAPARLLTANRFRRGNRPAAPWRLSWVATAASLAIGLPGAWAQQGEVRTAAGAVPAASGVRPAPPAPAAIEPGATEAGPPTSANAPAAPPDSSIALPAVRVTAAPEREGRATIAGWGDTPAWQLPAQAQRYTQDALKDVQVQRLADMVKLDASTSDSYNTTGYWDYLSVRGFVLDNAYNYRREGLPINAETRLALDNKAVVELLKGTSGIQAGQSAPGGLVNLLVKRPQGRVRQAELALTGGSSVKAAVDLGDRFGIDQQFGVRLNAATERLAPDTDNTRGHRHLLAAAADWRLTPDTLVEVEIEHSRLRQPSVPGFSLLGSRLPSVNDTDPGINLNDQPWTLPVEMQGNTGTVRWRQAWSGSWTSVVTYGEQRLRSNDRAAFPFGCDAEGVYDRYCSDGRFDLYDYRSEGESRITRALEARLQGQLQLGGTRHDVTLGLLRSLHRTDLSTALFNYPPVGTGDIDGDFPALPPDASEPASPQADRNERSTELSLQDAIEWNAQWRTWVGVRHARLRRTSAPTDGISPETRADADVTTPWLAVGYTWAPGSQVYASWGRGVELKTVPALGYGNSAEVLPVMRSRQVELGVKQQSDHGQWGVNLFQIDRDMADEVWDADGVTKRLLPDGQARHRGVEGQWSHRWSAWTLQASAMLLHAERTDSATVSGKRPVNVPSRALKASTAYRWDALPGLPNLPVTVQADLVHEGPRWADRLNEVRLPSWTRVDASIKAVQRLSGGTGVTWRLGVFNLLDRRAWRESPTLTGHVYLFPMASRTLTASAQIDF